MAKVQVIQSAPNIVRISSDSVSVSIVEQKTSVSVTASNVIEIPGAPGAGAGTPHEITSAITVTNSDPAMGEAVGKVYGVSTPIEDILKDILEPVPDSSLGSPSFSYDANSSGSVSTSYSKTFDFGTPVALLGAMVTLVDSGAEFNDTATLQLKFSGGALATQYYPVSSLNASTWKDLEGALTIDSSISGFSIVIMQETSLRTVSIALTFVLEATNAGGVTYFPATSPIAFNFYKRRWLLASTISLVEDMYTGLGSFNTFLEGCVTMDEGLYSSTGWSGASVTSSGSASDKYVYIVVPSELYINTNVASSINTGTSDVGTAFLLSTQLSYNTGYQDSFGNDVFFDVKIYKSVQLMPFASGVSLNILSTL